MRSSTIWLAAASSPGCACAMATACTTRRPPRCSGSRLSADSHRGSPRGLARLCRRHSRTLPRPDFPLRDLERARRPVVLETWCQRDRVRPFRYRDRRGDPERLSGGDDHRRRHLPVGFVLPRRGPGHRPVPLSGCVSFHEYTAREEKVFERVAALKALCGRYNPISRSSRASRALSRAAAVPARSRAAPGHPANRPSSWPPHAS